MTEAWPSANETFAALYSAARVSGAAAYATLVAQDAAKCGPYGALTDAQLTAYADAYAEAYASSISGDIWEETGENR